MILDHSTKIPKRDRATTEAQLMQDIRSALAREPDVKIMRNVSTALRDTKGRVVGRAGLGLGSPDLVAMVRVRCLYPGPWQMQIVARWLCIEVKTPHGKTEKSHLENQKSWIESARAMGAVAGFATSVEEALMLLRVCRGE